MPLLRTLFESVLSSSPDAVAPTGADLLAASTSTPSSSNKSKSPGKSVNTIKNNNKFPNNKNNKCVNNNNKQEADMVQQQPPAVPYSPSKTSKLYRQLKRQCLRKGQLFVDMEFPPSNESLFLHDDGGTTVDVEIEWRRPGEIVEDPKLFVEGASPCDVTQGILGNCWFVSACSALTHNEALLHKVIPDADGQEWGVPGSAYCGIFQFCFWRFGRWVDVIIDDLLPTKDGQLLFARSKTPNEFWSALLEKAFAKLYGCYESLVGGQLADALIELSGGVAETLNVRKFLDKQQQQPQSIATATTSPTKSIRNGFMASTSTVPSSTVLPTVATTTVVKLATMPEGEVGPPAAEFAPTPIASDGAKRLFRTLKYAFDREALIVAAIAAKKEEIERSLDCGLVMGHAYAVTAIRYIDLDNNNLEEEQNQTEAEQLDVLLHHPRKRQAVIRLQNPWGMKEWNGPWSDGSAEWEQVTEAQKQRLGITVDEDGEFWMPWEEFVHYFTDISVCQLLTTGTLTECKQRREEQPQLGMSMRLKASRRSVATVGMPEKRWREWTFFGRWSSNGVKPGAPKDRAGGSANFPATFCCNPQFVFDVPDDGNGQAELMVALAQRDFGCPFENGAKNSAAKHKKGQMPPSGKPRREPLAVIGLHLMRVEQNRKHRIHQAVNQVCCTDYLSSRSIHMHIDELLPGRYILMPTTYAPREEAEFMLRMYSPAQLCPTELRLDVPPAGLLRCRFQTEGVARLRILDLELQRLISFGESELFCMVRADGGEQSRTMLECALPAQCVKFNESFVFHLGDSPRRRCNSATPQGWFITIELFAQQSRIRRRQKYRLLGSTRLEVVSNNECTEHWLELYQQQKGKNNSSKKLVGNLRVELCSYDDPFYI